MTTDQNTRSIRRRRYVQMVGAMATIGLAGCSSILGGGSSGPEFDVENEELLLTVEDFPNDWQRNDESDHDFARAFSNSSGAIIVGINAEIHDEVSEAKDAMSSKRDEYSDSTEWNFADEGFEATQDDEIAYATFRDSNAIGSAAAFSEGVLGSIPEQGRARENAQTMYDNWQDL